jgi:hypothetical protein
MSQAHAQEAAMHGGYSRAYRTLRFADVPRRPSDAEELARIGLIDSYWGTAPHGADAPAPANDDAQADGAGAPRFKTLLKRAVLL